MNLINIAKESDIPKKYRDTPIGDLIRYNNLKVPFQSYVSAHILVAMCMDNRKQLSIPENFAYIIRTGGANLRYSEFKVSYAIAISKLRYIILIAHNDCGMVNLMAKKDAFIDGLVETAGWERERAESHFLNYAPMFEIDDEKRFVIDESRRLMNKYQGITVVPAYYTLENNRLSLLEE